uniref:Uncharacterized protein n=1 Tax=Arundo donax TaxID=35708 RepID=A0A0A9A9Z6_ARUDO
MTDPYTCSR